MVTQPLLPTDLEPLHDPYSPSSSMNAEEVQSDTDEFFKRVRLEGTRRVNRVLGSGSSCFRFDGDFVPLPLTQHSHDLGVQADQAAQGGPRRGKGTVK